MTSLKEFDKLSKDYADARQVLADRIQAMNDEVEAIKRKYFPSVRHAASKARDLSSKLEAAIENGKEHFKNPKTMTIHGIKFGLMKKADDLKWENEQQVINKIKKLMVSEIDVLINKKETVCKTALKQISEPQLKKIGVLVVPGTDVVVIKDTTNDIEKMVKRLLAEGEKLKEAA